MGIMKKRNIWRKIIKEQTKKNVQFVLLLVSIWNIVHIFLFIFMNRKNEI